MNAVQYVTTYATSCGYCGKLNWSNQAGGCVADKHNYAFMHGRVFTEDEVIDIQEGLLLVKEIRAQAVLVERRLKQDAREFLKPYGIPASLYRYDVEFKDVTCTIYCTHKKNGNCIVLREVYFANDGEILQAVMLFR